MPRFRIESRDAPAEIAARRLGLAVATFAEKLPNLIARGFPRPDPDTGNFDLVALDRWCDARHSHLFKASEAFGALDARVVVGDRIAKMRASARDG
jgi:hypothetical protein